MKKILFVCNDSVLYGSEIAMLNIIDNLNPKKYEVYVLLPRHGEIEQELQKRNIAYRIVKYFSWAVSKKNIINCIKFFIKYLINLFSLYKIKSFIKNQKFDIIHSLNSCVYFGSALAKKCKIKHVWHFREYNVDYASNRLLEKRIKQSDLIVCISKAVYNKFQHIIGYCNYEIIYDGIDTEPYKNIKKKSTKDNYNLLIAGALNHNKGQIIAIKAVEELIKKNICNIILYIAGTGEDEDYLKAYVKTHKLSDNVIFLGYRKDLNSFRNNVDIYLMCSLKEGWGYVTIESLLSKNLVIASNTGGTIEIIKDNVNGFLFEPNNSHDLSEKIEYSIVNWEKCVEIVEYAYNQAIKNYDIKLTIEKLENVYEHL